MTMGLESDNGFDPILKHLAFLAILESCDTMKQSVDDYIYMKNYFFTGFYI